MIIHVKVAHAHDFHLRCQNRGDGPLLCVKLLAMEINKEQTFIVSKDVLFQEVSGETVLLDLASESYFGLDEIGTRIWTLINEGRAVGEVTDTLLEEYEVDRTTLEADLHELLSSLLDAGLMSSGDSDPDPGAE